MTRMQPFRLEDIWERLNFMSKEAGITEKGRSLLTSCTVRVLLELMQFVTAKAAKKLSGCTNGGEKSGNKRDFYN